MNAYTAFRRVGDCKYQVVRGTYPKINAITRRRIRNAIPGSANYYGAVYSRRSIDKFHFKTGW